MSVVMMSFITLGGARVFIKTLKRVFQIAFILLRRIVFYKIL